MKKIIFLFLCLFFHTAYAQQTLSLAQCLEYAYKNANSIQKADLDIQSAKARVRETIGIGLPQLSGSAGVIYNFELAPAFLPANFFADPNAPPPSPDADFVPARGIFAPRYQGSAGITLSQIIFSGSYLVGLQASRTYTQLSQRNLEATKITVTENVTKAYFSLLVAKERSALLDNNIIRLDSIIGNTKALNKQGFVENIEVARLEVTANNLKTEKDKIQRLIQLSNELLKFQMGMPAQEKIEISGSIRDFALQNVSNEPLKANYDSRVEYNNLKVAKRLSELDLKNKRTGYYPALLLVGGTGYQTGTRYFSNIGDFKNRWLGYGNIGLQLQVPIFDGFQKKYRIQQSRIELLKLDQDRQNLEKLIDLQTNQSQIILNNATSSLDAQKRNMELSKEVLRISEIKYKQGVGTSLDIVNAQSAYKESEINYYGALYDALIAKVDLDKALGQLAPK